MRNNISEEEIIRAGRKYIEQKFRAFATRAAGLGQTGGTTDDLIECPKCGGFIQYRTREGWECLTRRCDFSFPKELTPPSPEELERYYNFERIKKSISMFLGKGG